MTTDPPSVKVTENFEEHSVTKGLVIVGQSSKVEWPKWDSKLIICTEKGQAKLNQEQTEIGEYIHQ